ncbi:MAG: shikimate kinase [Candidatus Thalassarchaeaceae archaeon]|jgi:shikimate kinase|tara:strand:+ start:5455 stop:6294 length:840 start_codon:yes stop_codon:yes gene_type:complete
MNILGEGVSYGGISILHSLGVGKGCSVGIQLSTKVTLIDEINNNSNDVHSLLESVMGCWRDSGRPVPNNYGWDVYSQIPIGQGLKSSSALACAAIKALNSAFWTNLEDSEIIDLAVEAQRRAGCTITGSMDDTWSSMTSGWKLVDPSRDASKSILLEGSMDVDLSILICIRGPRDYIIDSNKFVEHQKLFKKSLSSIMDGNLLDAMRANGIALAAITKDDMAIKISNLAIINGALSAGISGSGPAIAIVCYKNDVDNIEKALRKDEIKILRTSFLANLE